MTFELYPLRFRFVARDPITFPPGTAANILRGAFGTMFRRIACTEECPNSVRECPHRHSCPYARVFEPQAAEPGPSGLKDWPRPFVFRASHLDGARIEPGQRFWFGLNLFTIREPFIPHFVQTFEALGKAGFGPARSRAGLIADDRSSPPLSIPLTASTQDIGKLRVEFLTPTELKTADGLSDRPEFAILFARARDRVGTLRALYGAGPLDIDFRAMGERAAQVKLTRFELRHVDVERRSSRTGQVHGIGGVVGWAEYEGDLAEFLPYLEAARWTGVGRQCVWGKGELCYSRL
jgi:hypothetical protein